MRADDLTLQDARAAARAVRAKRPNGKFVVVTTVRGKALRDRYLGAIVHAAPKLASAVRGRSMKSSSAKSSSSKGAARKG